MAFPEGRALPIVGYSDYHWADHNITADLKTTERMPSEVKVGHARQVALYVTSNNAAARVTYCTPKKCQTYAIDNIDEHRKALHRIALKVENFLSLSDDPGALPRYHRAGSGKLLLGQSGIAATGVRTFRNLAMKQIELTKGYFAIVDDDDFERLSQHKWTAMVTGQNIKRVYAYRRTEWDNANRRWMKSILMHREIMQAVDGLDVDHINHDTLDNRKENLRCATRSQNLANNRRARGETGMRGVVRTQRREKEPYQVMCRTKHIGRFLDLYEAARAYDSAALKEFGEFARLNFPD